MKNLMDWIMTPAHLTIICLVLHTFLKGFQDALGAHKTEKKDWSWFGNVMLDTLLYCTAGRRSNV